jgi:RES domain-containing protein
MPPRLTVYRICKTKYSAAAFDGEGAYRFGGRWNSRGTRLIYTAGSLALAPLEMLVHLKDETLLAEYSYLSAQLDQNLILPVGEFRPLPPEWSASPAPLQIQQIGDEWARSLISPVLEIPTSVIPLEKNYLLNPAHPDFQRIVLGEAKRFTFDERLVKK